MNTIPKVVDATYRGGYTIRIRFSDGVENEVDFSSWLKGPVFEPLEDTGYFERFFVEAGTIAWPNGADVAPETLYERAKSNEAA